MQFRTGFFAAAVAVLIGGQGLASDASIVIEDAYARAATAKSTSGAAFMIVKNHAEADDRLIAAASDIAQRVELHTHIENSEGVMRMVEVKDGFPIAAGGQHALRRGGDHVMFMGLNQSLEQGDSITLTLTFEQAGDVTVEIPVDLERKPAHGGGHSHGTDG